MNISGKTMRYKVVVFDFDGTLVQSNQVKREAYYHAFPASERYRTNITQILKEFPELNRYDTIEKIIALTGDDLSSQEVVDTYNKLVLEGVIGALELDFAARVLEFLRASGVNLYLSSNTPLDVLDKIISARNLKHYFCDISGYPSKKSDFLGKLIANNKFLASEYLVVGDGNSDRLSASTNGAHFFYVDSNSLENLYKKLTISGC
ncbi:HAD family hydrolase [Vibrio coralliilyticus]|uniref:HAD family hydrolase n=1 Tax=Vibrio coralliilyticus TaxID=190893 RepID=UPI001560CA30|nr:HAD family hydrolase [Vibrio coralliilyticus]NRF33151.1 HAD family hydrolase [Vibrio coralliilyticus]NRF55670.1 HAD family hydrolase [Vibrio coralliilyticus]